MYGGTVWPHKVLYDHITVLYNLKLNSLGRGHLTCVGDMTDPMFNPIYLFSHIQGYSIQLCRDSDLFH